jgi:hypothetical protein
MTVSCSPQGQQQLSVQLKMMEKSEQVTLNTTEMKFTAVHRAAFWTVAVGSPAFSPRSEFTTFIEGNIGGGKVFFFSKQKDGGPLPITRPSLSRGSGNLFFENVLSTCFIQNKGLENLMQWYKTAHERHRGPGCFFLSRGSAALPAHVREHSGVRAPPPHARSPLDDATADFSIAIATIKEGDEEPYGSTNII